MALSPTQINELYVAYFGRPADYQGALFYENNNATADQVAAAFSTSQESIDLYGATFSPAVINAIYQNLFNRTPDLAGLTYWVTQVQTGALNPAQVALAIANGAQGDDKTAIANKVTIANAFVADLDTSAEALGYAGDDAAQSARAFLKTVDSTSASLAAAQAAVDTQVAAAVALGNTNAGGSTFTLTLDQDTLTGTGGNDIFNAGASASAVSGFPIPLSTLQDIDSLDGGTGIDTLNVTLTGGFDEEDVDILSGLVTPVLKNIENINIRSVNEFGSDTDGSSLDLISSSGVTQIAVANSTADTYVYNAGAVDTVSISDQNSSVTFSGMTSTKLALNLSNVGTNGAYVDVNLGSDDTPDGPEAAAKATTLNVTVANSNVYIYDDASDTDGIATTITVAATGTNFIDFEDGEETATSLTVTGTGSIDLSDGDFLKLATIDASANTGGVQIAVDGAHLTTATFGSGADTLYIEDGTPLGAAAVVNMGAGDDTLVINSGVTAGATLSGGDGTDTLSMTDANYALISAFSTANAAKITGFEVLSIQDATAANVTYDLSKISGGVSSIVLESGIETTWTTTVTHIASGGNVTLEGDLFNNAGGLVVTLTDATGSSDSLNINLNSYDDQSPTVVNLTTAGVETLNIATALDDDDTSDHTTYTVGVTDTSLTNLVLTGTQAVSFTSTADMTKLAKIDASALTAGVTIDVSLAATTSAAVTVLGTTKADTFTVGNNATVTGGGGADTFNVHAPTSGQTYSDITDAIKGDVIVFSGPTDPASAVLSDTFNSTKISLASTAVFQDYLDAAAHADLATAGPLADPLDPTTGTPVGGVISWFQWNGDTYIVEDASDDAVFSNSHDTVVKLTGTIDLSKATVTDLHQITL